MYSLLSEKLSSLIIALGLLGNAIAATPATYEVRPLHQELVIKSPVASQDGITEENVWSVIDGLIACESRGVRGTINPKDVDGRPKYGELQFDSRTWAMWEKEFGFKGDPMNRHDAIEMTRLALLAGYGYNWGCFKQVVH